MKKREEAFKKKFGCDAAEEGHHDGEHGAHGHAHGGLEAGHHHHFDQEEDKHLQREGHGHVHEHDQVNGDLKETKVAEPRPPMTFRVPDTGNEDGQQASAAEIPNGADFSLEDRTRYVSFAAQRPSTQQKAASRPSMKDDYNDVRDKD